MPTESFFSSASLAYLASAGAGKDGKTYSIKPTDGTGDFTFSRGSNLAATRVGADGLIEKGRENLFLYSNKFDESYWQKLNGCSVLGQTATDPFGVANNAWLVNFDGTTNARLEKQVSGSQVKTMSIYVRTQSGTQDVIIGFGGTELVTKTITTTWQRIEKFTPDNIYPRLRCDSATTLEVFGFQLELGPAATDYIESAGATTGKAGLLEDEPRFDYSGGATCPSLLLEPSRTQLIGNSELINPTIDTTWKQVGSNTFTNNYGTAPDGTQTSTLIEFGGTNSSFQAYYQTAVTANSHTISIYAKGSGSFKLGIYDNTSILTDLITLSSEWQRFEVTKTTAATSAARCVWLYPNGDGDTIEVWGAQTEEGSYPTSYIPNHSGGSVTRGVDECENAGDVNTFNSTEGVLYFEAKTDNTQVGSISINDGTSSNRITARFRADINKIQLSVIGSTDDFNLNSDIITISDYNKIAIVYNNGDYYFFVNGIKGNVESKGTFSANTFTQFDFNRGGGGEVFAGNSKQILYFNEALSDADCISLTS